MPHPSPVIKEMSSLSNITLKKPGISNKRKNTKGEDVGTFINLHCNITVRTTYGDNNYTSGGSRGGPPLLLDQTEARRAAKILGGRPLHPYLRVWMTAPPSPPPAISRSGSGTKYHNDFRRCTSLHYSYKIRGILKFSRKLLQ